MRKSMRKTPKKREKVDEVSTGGWKVIWPLLISFVDGLEFQTDSVSRRERKVQRERNEFNGNLRRRRKGHSSLVWKPRMRDEGSFIMKESERKSKREWKLLTLGDERVEMEEFISSDQNCKRVL